MDAKITVICYKSKVLSNGENPLMLRITKNRKRSMKSLGVSLNPDYWNFDKNKPKPECPNKEELEQLILKTKIKYQQKLLSAKINGEEFTSETLLKKSVSKIKQLSVEQLLESIFKAHGITATVFYNTIDCYGGIRPLKRKNEKDWIQFLLFQPDEEL